MKRIGIAATAAVMVMLVVPVGILAQIQIPKQVSQGIDMAAKGFKSLSLTEEEERQLGSDISAQLREKYGVVQDANVHRYVTLVGTTLVERSSRPKLRWTFVVLDTDGVNAFAAPGGFIHITRGALALLENEAELAGVLGHEITHVTAKHTVNAVKQSKFIDAMAPANRGDFLTQLATHVGQKVLENQFDLKDELESDRTGIALANTAGYAPSGLSGFLARLAERNKGLKERSGVFGSHPETQSRLDDIAKTIKAKSLKSAALVQARWDKTIQYTVVPVGQIAQVAPPTAAATAKPAEKKPATSGGLGSVGSALGLEKSNSSTVASTGSRGVNPDRDAKGGPNKALIVTIVTAAEVDAFKQGIK